jgi:hypothetical protein
MTEKRPSMQNFVLSAQSAFRDDTRKWKVVTHMGKGSTLRQTIMSLNLNFTFVSAIVERQHDGEAEVLVQTRWKPDSDPRYSGTLEIPAGSMNQFENVYDAITREVLEETGLRITGFRPDLRSKM